MVSGSSSSLGKVCVITNAIVDREVGRHLYIVDLDRVTGEMSRYLPPTAKVNGDILNSSALCVIGSSLFVFEAESVDEYGVPDKLRKLVYSYELSSTSVMNLNLKDNMLVKVCAMKDTKFSPCAMATPDGSKIVVYSSAIRPFYSNKRCDFELFDVKGGRRGRGECRKLPQLRPWQSWERQKDISIISAVFKGGSTTLLLVLLETRIYSLNLLQPIDWEPFTHFRDSIPMGTPFDLIGEDICLTSFKAYDVGTALPPVFSRPACSFTYPDLSKSDEIRGPLYPILLDASNPRDAKFCILHAGTEQLDHSYSIPHYIVDVYTCDVEEFIRFRQGMKDSIPSQPQTFVLPTTTKLKSLRFRLTKDYTYLLRKCRFTSIPPHPFNFPLDTLHNPPL